MLEEMDGSMGQYGRDAGPAGVEAGAADLARSQDPVVHISEPHDGDAHSAALPVVFAGSATDEGGAALAGGELQWKSSLDGPIGSGNGFTRTLSPGVHLITLTATDGKGRTGSDHVTVTSQ